MIVMIVPLLLAATPLAAAQNTAPQAAPGQPAAATVCRSVRATGSNAARRVCRPQAEWDRQDHYSPAPIRDPFQTYPPHGN